MLKFKLNHNAMDMASGSDSTASISNEVSPEAAMAASATAASLNGQVSRLRANWSVHEDGALAQKLQSEEISQHLRGNRQRNHQIREDVPRAREEQVREVEIACKIAP